MLWLVLLLLAFEYIDPPARRLVRQGTPRDTEVPPLSRSLCGILSGWCPSLRHGLLLILWFFTVFQGFGVGKTIKELSLCLYDDNFCGNLGLVAV